MVRDASIRLHVSIATAPVAISASGAVQPPTALAASIVQPASTRSEKICRLLLANRY